MSDAWYYADGDKAVVRETDPNAPAVKREAEEDQGLENSAPTSVPRRHITDARYPGSLFENDKRKLSGMLWVFSTSSLTPVRETSITRHS
jgi:hypothetical protein